MSDYYYFWLIIFFTVVPFLAIWFANGVLVFGLLIWLIVQLRRLMK